MIYMIVNRVTKDFYIGSTSNYKKRINTHKRLLKKNKHHSIKLQRAYNKYGNSVFYFYSYIKCKKEDNLIVEQLCLDMLDPIYNVAKIANSPMQGRRHKNSTKLKMSNAHKGNKYNLGRKATKEQKNNRSIMRTGYRHSKKTKEKMSITAKKLNSIKRIKGNRKRQIIDNFCNIFESVAEASRYYNKSSQTIIDILKNRHKKTREGVSFSYHNKSQRKLLE